MVRTFVAVGDADAIRSRFARVAVLATGLTAAPDSVFTATTGADGSYSVALPDWSDEYRVAPSGGGMPPGAVVAVPPSGGYGIPPVAPVSITLVDYLADGVDFLLARCAGGTPSPTPTATFQPSGTPTPVVTPDPLRGAFQCYEVDRASADPIDELVVDDRFGIGTIDVTGSGRVKRFCNPAAIDGEPSSAPSDPGHLIGYRLSRRTPRFAPRAHWRVANRFGATSLLVARPMALLVPSAKSLDAPLPPVADLRLDHFQCYAVRRARTRASGLAVVDQFGGHVLDVKRPARLCVAADAGEGVRDPDAALLCYEVRTSAGAPVFRGPAGPVYVTNRFGSDTLAVTRATELCVPSAVAPPLPMPVSP